MPKNLDLFGDSQKSQKALPSLVLPYREFKQSDLLDLSVLSTSKGNQTKYRSLDGNFYIKEQFLYNGAHWKDYLVEVVASQYAGHCALPDRVSVVAQGLCVVDGRPSSYSRAFDYAGDFFLSYSHVCGHRITPRSTKGFVYRDWFTFIADTLSDAVGYNALPYMVTMSLLDLVVGNEDRHLNNFGLIEHQDECHSLDVAPLFDFGLGMFEHDTEYDGLDFQRAFKKVRIMPSQFKVLPFIDFLLDNYGSLVSSILPERVVLEEYTFPSLRGRLYFQTVNERLGVKVV